MRSTTRRRALAANAYGALAGGCNACQAAAGFGFNRGVRPPANPDAKQAFVAPEASAQ